MNSVGKSLMVLGIMLFLSGSVVLLVQRLGLGRLPGDIFIQRKQFTLYIPLATSLLISLLLTLIYNLFFRR